MSRIRGWFLVLLVVMLVVGSVYIGFAGVPQDRKLNQEDGDIKVYWIQNGVRYHVVSADVLNAMAGVTGWSWDAINKVPAGALSSIPEGPSFIEGNSNSTGILIRQIGDTRVYALWNGQRHWIRSGDALTFTGHSYWDDVIDVSASIMNNFVPTVGGDIFAIMQDASVSTAKQPCVDAYLRNANQSTLPWPGRYSTYLGFAKESASTVRNSSKGTNYLFQNFDGPDGASLEYHASGPNTGSCFEVHGGILSKWAALGYAGSFLGLPTSDEREPLKSPQGTSGRVNDFEGGHIHWHRDGPRANNAYETHGAIDAVYVSVGGTASFLGFPISDEYTNSSGHRQSDFEGGCITTLDGTNYQALPGCTPPTNKGTIQVNATLNGAAWFGSVNYNLGGPQPTNGNSAPLTFSNQPTGTYTLNYTSGGPSGATFQAISPTTSQNLSSGSTITFTLSFTTNTNPKQCDSGSPLSQQSLADLIKRHFPDGTVSQTGMSIWVTAYAVARAESKGNPNACGDLPTKQGISHSFGLWQINLPAHPKYDTTSLFDPEYNANAAVEISGNGATWTPWCTWEKNACGGTGNESYKDPKILQDACDAFPGKCNIAPPTITVVWPNGGENVPVASPAKIMWNSTSLTGKVRIELYAPDSNGNFGWTTLISSTANDGNETWRWDLAYRGSKDNWRTTEHVKIKVTSIVNPSVTDTSDGEFTLSCGGGLQSPGNPYPCCTNGGNCTYWAWEMARVNWGVQLPRWGNAKNWASAAKVAGYTVSSIPAVGTLAIRTLGKFGHVAWVTGVNGNTVTVSEMNCNAKPAQSNSRTYNKSFFTGGFIYRPGTAPASQIIRDVSFIIENARVIKVDIFGLDGHRILEKITSNIMPSIGQLSKEGNLASGVYLYVITTRQRDGTIIRSEVKKLIILQ